MKVSKALDESSKSLDDCLECLSQNLRLGAACATLDYGISSTPGLKVPVSYLVQKAYLGAEKVLCTKCLLAIYRVNRFVPISVRADQVQLVMFLHLAARRSNERHAKSNITQKHHGRN